MDPEMIAYFDAHFGETSRQFSEVQQQVASLREETLRRFEQVDRRFELVETTCRQTLVLVEGLRHELQLVAEGYLGVNERLQVQIDKTELLASEVHGWMEPYFKDLDIRVKKLDIRVKGVEGRVDRQNMDVFEAVRKVLGRPPTEQQ